MCARSGYHTLYVKVTKILLCLNLCNFEQKLFFYIFFRPLCFKTKVECLLGPQSKSVLEIVFLDLRESMQHCKHVKIG